MSSILHAIIRIGLGALAGAATMHAIFCLSIAAGALIAAATLT